MDIKYFIAYGKYGWCGSMGDRAKPYSCVSTLSTIGKKSNCIEMIIELEDWLYELHLPVLRVLYEYPGGAVGDLQYNKDSLKKINKMKFTVDSKFLDKEWKIVIGYWDRSGLSPASFSRGEFVELYSKKINVETPEIFTNGRCNICFEEYKDDDEVSKTFCRHKFHSKCVWNYLTTTNKKYVSSCDESCPSHGDMAKEFACPECMKNGCM